MQISLNPLERLFLQQGFIHLAHKVITYIDTQTLLAVIDSQQQYPQVNKGTQTEIIAVKSRGQSKIKRLIQVHCLMKEYLNKTDRSMYFPLYDEPEFKTFQSELQENIVINEAITQANQNNFSLKFQQLNQIFHQIRTQQLLSHQQLQELKRILADPCLPLPPLKRENQGTHCNSSFQLFLVGLRFPHCNQQGFTPFEDFRQKLDDQEDANFKQFLEIEKQKQKPDCIKVYEHLHLLRYMPYQVTHQNFLNLYLPTNSPHNLIVTLFALIDVFVSSTLALITIIDDPFYQFVELLSRYAAFRSLILDMEDSLGFLFKAYETLYADTIRDSLFETSNMKPKFCFWRPALAKWFLKMSPIHAKTNHVYFLLLTKLRQQALLSQLDASNPSPAWKPAKKHAITLQNRLQLHPLSSNINQKIHHQTPHPSLLEQFISDNPQTCEALLFQYVEYFVDLSVNEQTVHWCGHSCHRLEEPFDLFIKEFTKYNESFVLNLKQNVLADVAQKDTRKTLLQLFIQSDLQFLETKNVKPVMLRQFVDDINRKGKFFEDFLIEDQKSEKILEGQKIVEDKIVMDLSKETKSDLIFVNFTETDQRLKYFNAKAKICESIQGEEKVFFSIPPLLSPQQILAKSINTNATSDDDDDQDLNSSFQYVSDDQCQREEQATKQSTQHQKSEEKAPLKHPHPKLKQVKKKVKFQQDAQDINLSQQPSNQKQTLHSTNSSTKDTTTFTLLQQSQKSLVEEESLLITKSQSI